MLLLLLFPFRGLLSNIVKKRKEKLVIQSRSLFNFTLITEKHHNGAIKS